MKKEIIINAAENSQRIAIIEDGQLAELFIESEEKERMVGDVYLGTVAKVMDGIQASFIDIGLEQDGFLHYSDVGNAFRDFGAITGDKDEIDRFDDDDEDEDEDENEEDGKTGKGKDGRGRGRQQGKPRGPQRRPRRPPSQVQLTRGQEIVVQIFKEPVGNKGVRVTTEVALPGRFVVLMPFDNKIGVSRKIANFKEKRRLRRLVRGILPSGYGVIIRTVAEGKPEDVLRADLEALVQAWREIERTLRKSRPPTLLYKDMNTSSSTMRDLFSEDVTRVAVDSRKLYRDFRAYLNLVAPHKVDVLQYHGEGTPIFDAFEIEKQIQQSMSRKVWLKSGGYIIIEHTEAMKVIDVNSGRYAAKREQELNSMRTNMEAAREITRQVRLRDLGGIIVIDFIDMEHEENRRKLLDEMRREMRRDRAKFTILPLSDFGLMQITRQRVRDSVQLSLSEVCPTCQGTGRVLSKSSMLTELERWMRRFRAASKELRLTLHVHPSMAAFLTEGTLSPAGKLMLRYFVRLRVEEDPALPIDEFRFVSRRRNRDVTREYRE
ncbi:MAG: Rne/Rng family ribonuclease [Bacteroidetes bacterium]|nr:Rne/Rng family ribonuclease [Bacteroidota bacterium]